MAALRRLKAAGYEQPFWMPQLWPSHLMFLSLLWQNGGEPYAEEGDAALFDSRGGRRGAGVAAVDRRRAATARAEVGIDTQYAAFKNGETSITWDGIWQINDLSRGRGALRHRADPDHRRGAGGVGQLAQLLHHPPGDRRREQVRRRAGVHRLDERAVRRVGRLRDDPGPPVGPRQRCHGRHAAGGHRRGRSTPCGSCRRSRASVPSRPRRSSPRWPSRSSARPSPADALASAAEQATELMQENLESFGG